LALPFNLGWFPLNANSLSNRSIPLRFTGNLWYRFEGH
jgi:hypothetical protein